jgi:inorganic pyrophosphatase/exopolyphosphatase
MADFNVHYTTTLNDMLEEESNSPMPSPDRKDGNRLMRGSSSFDLQSKTYYENQGEDGSLVRNRTTIEEETMKRQDAAEKLVDGMDDPLFNVSSYIPPLLEDAIFCGHLVTDMDSIAGAIGAADLYGGIAARASEINSETKFCLEYWGMAAPRPVEELLKEFPDRGVCLVDHQQTSQLNKSIPTERIVGIIDHHALQNATIVTDQPIYIDIRPWGSMSTIIAHNFLMIKKRPRKCVAGMLMCAILSDTLNLMGPTTTNWDRMIVSVLVQITGVPDIQELAAAQFKAKSRELAGMSSGDLVNGDQKTFSFKTELFEGKLGFAVIETTDDDVILARKDELLIALSEDKATKELDLLFLAVVNIVKLKSTLLMQGTEEEALAYAAFNPGMDTGSNPKGRHMLDLGNLVSRKKDFIPKVTKAINNGFTMPVTKVTLIGSLES